MYVAGCVAHFSLRMVHYRELAFVHRQNALFAPLTQAHAASMRVSLEQGLCVGSLME